MKNSIVVPFDLNTARKIKSGEIEGSVLINNIEIELEACDKAAELAVIYADALIKELK